MLRLRCLVLLLAALVAHLRAADISGSWQLNVDQSRWGNRPKPQSATLNIEHQEPAIKYSGRVMNPTGEDGRDYTFSGAIDGKPYPATSAYGPGKLTIKRVDDSTTTSQFQSDDGKYTETARTSISRDGKRLTRRMTAQGPQGRSTWTEVYDRR
jgi:hypothetical protein